MTSKSNIDTPQFSFKFFLAGSLSGVFQKSIVQPLDLVRTRMQVQTMDGSQIERNPKNLDRSILKHPSFRSVVTSIYKEEGLRAFYTGLGPNLLGSAVAWGVYFQVYNTTKRYFIKNHDC